MSLSFACHTFSYAAPTCGDITLTGNTSISTPQTNIVNLPPRFADVTVECDTVANTLCSTEMNVADNTTTLDITTPGAYTNLNDYNFLRSNKSIFPNFDHEVILTLTFTTSPGSNFGAAVAVSGDGSTVAAGCLFAPSPLLGFVNVYKRYDNTWILAQQITRPIGLPLDPIDEPSIPTFGSSLSLSYDGSVLAIGAIPPQNSGYTQPAYVFMYNYQADQSTYTLSQQIPGSGSGGFGSVLAVSANGKYLVVNDDISRSLSVDDAFYPTTWIYEKNNSCANACYTNSQWILQQRLVPLENNKLIYRDSSFSFGQYLTISADGSVIVMSMPQQIMENVRNGMVVIFNKAADTWQQSQLIVSSSVPTATREFGSAVALSANGTYLAVGDPSGIFQPRQKVFIFAKRGTSYVLETTLFAPQPSTFQFSFGAALSFSANGTVLAIGDQFRALYIAVRGPGNT